jgi:hypothetical protein
MEMTAAADRRRIGDSETFGAARVVPCGARSGFLTRQNARIDGAATLRVM